MQKTKKKLRQEAARKFINVSKGTLFDISAKPLVFRCKEDGIFFENQKNERTFYIGSLDKEDSRKINENNDRKERNKRKQILSDETSIYSRPTITDIALQAENEANENVSKRQRTGADGEWVAPSLSDRRRYQLKKDLVSVTVDRKKWIDNAAATVDKNMLSGRKGLCHYDGINHSF